MSDSFLTKPLDYSALRTILTTLLVSDQRSDIYAMVCEMQILVEEAERSGSREAWDERILERWRDFETVMRQEHGVSR